MYYRVAIQADASPTWQWKSTPLSSLNIVKRWLQYYRVLPLDRLRIFSSREREDLTEQLLRENQGLGSSSVPALQFLQERRIPPQVVEYKASTCETQANERSVSPLDKRREELESGACGDHDPPYRFTLPTSMPQVLAWLTLQVRVQQGDLQGEVVPLGTGKSSAGPLFGPLHLYPRCMARS
jgi:hypothetical protein